jgi:hypothetical protein
MVLRSRRIPILCSSASSVHWEGIVRVTISLRPGGSGPARGRCGTGEGPTKLRLHQARCAWLTLGEGALSGDTVECPWHGAHFNVKTGAVTNPPARASVRSFPVKIEGNDVLVEVD